MTAPVRHCLKCKHLDVDAGFGGTDATPGESAALRCWKGHFRTDDAMFDRFALAKKLESAVNCPDYEEDP